MRWSMQRRELGRACAAQNQLVASRKQSSKRDPYMASVSSKRDRSAHRRSSRRLRPAHPKGTTASAADAVAPDFDAEAEAHAALQRACARLLGC